MRRWTAASIWPFTSWLTSGSTERTKRESTTAGTSFAGFAAVVGFGSAACVATGAWSSALAPRVLTRGGLIQYR